MVLKGRMYRQTWILIGGRLVVDYSFENFSTTVVRYCVVGYYAYFVVDCRNVDESRARMCACVH